jgi:isoaspartyl peptidase/L-asparaginase-like protein (Ntn-hydrolase superfamily)
LVLVDRQGQVAFACNTPHMSVAWTDEDGSVQARIKA